MNKDANHLEDNLVECEWCNDLCEESDVVATNIGMLCSLCIQAIRSRGEEIIIL